MGDRATGQGVGIVGRDPELAALDRFLGPDRDGHALILTGGPGIGKTTIWDAAVDAASERDVRVLSARPAEAEAGLSYAALADLLDRVEPGVLATLPAPQRDALEVTLLRVPPSGARPQPRAVAAAVLKAFQALAARAPLLIAIDDVQWLDSPSARALAFAARRLDGVAVRWLLTERAGPWPALTRALEPDRMERIEVGGLSLGAARRVLAQRLGMSLPRRTMRRIFEATRGNPLFLLELGRTLLERGSPRIGEDIPVPDTVEELIGVRVSRLTAAERGVLLAVALGVELRTSDLSALFDAAAIDDALDAGLVIVDGERIRPAHPLLAAAARTRSRTAERTRIHRELARVAADDELAARHLALATATPDSELAGRVADAAKAASARGAAENAVELAEHALRLTPADSPVHTDRLLALAEYLMVAGEPRRASDVVGRQVDRLPAGRPRARAHLLLANSRWDASHVAECGDHLDRALAESGNDAALRAMVLAVKVRYTSAACAERIREAEAWALEALAGARAAGPQVERDVLFGLAWTRLLRGRPIGDLRDRFREISSDAAPLIMSLDRIAGERLAHRGEIHAARSILERLLPVADERGELPSYVSLRRGLCEIALRAGEWDEAERSVAESEGTSDRELLVDPVYERYRAFLAVGRGFADEAERWASKALAGIEGEGFRWHRLEVERARGTAALLAGDPRRAAETLGAIWEHTEREGIEDPGVFPVAPDLVEALLEVGETERAGAVTARLAELAEEQEHPWGRASAQRCRAMLALASAGDAEGQLIGAAAAYGALGLRFDRARCFLILGRAERRARKWGAARRSLGQALAAFEELGSPGWVEQARSDLARVGARRPVAEGQLTPTERHVVELAIDGLSNKEIAHALLVSVHTVEVHLTHAFAKLGVHSRAQLARRLAGDASRLGP